MGSVTPVVPDTTSQTVLPTPPPQPERAGGWYFNDEEDRYSFCEDTESELSEEEDEDNHK